MKQQQNNSNNETTQQGHNKNNNETTTTATQKKQKKPYDNNHNKNNKRARLCHVVDVHLRTNNRDNGKETRRNWKVGGGKPGPLRSGIQRWFTTTSCTAMLWMTTMESNTRQSA